MHRTQNPTAPAARTDIPTVDVTPADILRGAARYLEIHGWTQSDYYDGNQPFPPACVTGAIGMAAHGTRMEAPTVCGVSTGREFRLAFHCLAGYLTNLGAIAPHGDDWSTEPVTVFDWNDFPDQTARGVITTLRAAADEWTWQHATEDQLETYAEAELDNERLPTREGFLAWLSAR